MNKKFKIVFIIMIVLSCFLLIPKINAASFDFYIVKSKCYLRKSAGDTSEHVKDGNDNVMVYQNQELNYIRTEKGPLYGQSNKDWYAVKIDYAAKEYSGYVSASCVDVKTVSYSDDTEFEEKIKSFPTSYKPYLRRLHALHPNWTFKMDSTNLDWNSSVTAESHVGQSSISYLYPSLFYRDSSNPNGVVVDGTSWYAPCYDAVGYYLDPRNFLSEKYIFMFESLVYNSMQDSSVQGILKGSFMDNTFTEGGVTKTYTDAFIEAAKQSGVSSTHLASRSLQEMGTTKSSAASGTVAGYEGYYNFYNIGAYSGVDNYIKGLQRAKEEGWDSIQKAITGGAIFIANSYVNNGKDTLYFQKFNVSSKRKQSAYTYEYMTNIMAPSQEASKIYASYLSNGKTNSAYTFMIPVYNNMTTSAYKVSRTDTISGKVEDTSSQNNNTQTISAETKITNAGYLLKSGFLTNIALGTDISVLRQKLINQGATIGSRSNNNQTKVTGKVATGDVIEVDGKPFEVTIYGDIQGDAEISVVDLLYMKKSIIGDISLANPNKKAADINKDRRIDVVDLLLLKKYILGEYTINQ